MPKIKDAIPEDQLKSMNDKKQKLQDLTVQCVDCKNPFLFTAGEQQFYQDRGLAVPKRCPTCRLKRRNAPRTGSPYQNIPVEEKN